MEKLKITAKKFWNGINTFMHDESGMGTVEIILIIVVLIGLVIVFKQQIGGLVEDVFKVIKDDTKSVTG